MPIKMSQAGRLILLFLLIVQVTCFSCRSTVSPVSPVSRDSPVSYICAGVLPRGFDWNQKKGEQLRRRRSAEEAENYLRASHLKTADNDSNKKVVEATTTRCPGWEPSEAECRRISSATGGQQTRGRQ